jgi:hypothetical protein
MSAYNRGNFVKGENPYPWVQSFVAAAARTSYLYHTDSNSPFDIGLGTLISLGCCSFSGFVAVGISTGPKCKKLSGSMWMGIMISSFITWMCSRNIAGLYFVIVIGINRATLWIKIPHAIRNRDGR